MIRFGTGGWRAVIGDEFTKANIRILCQALANLMQSDQVTEPGMVIGYDRRFLSRESAEWAATRSSIWVVARLRTHGPCHPLYASR